MDKTLISNMHFGGIQRYVTVKVLTLEDLQKGKISDCIMHFFRGAHYGKQTCTFGVQEATIKYSSHSH